MKVSVSVQPGIPETQVTVACPKENREVREILTALGTVHTTVPCRENGLQYRLRATDILYIESVDRKTFLYTTGHIYECDQRLYMLEEALCRCAFFRCTKSTIVNLRRVQSLRPEIGSRLLLTMENGEKLIVSRQYAGNIKKLWRYQHEKSVGWFFALC